MFTSSLVNVLCAIILSFVLQVVCKAHLALYQDLQAHQAPLDPLRLVRASPHPSLDPPTEVTAPLPPSCSLVSLVSHQWAQCPLALHHLAMVHPQAHPHRSKAHLPQAPFLPGLLVLLVLLWHWPLHLTCVAPLLEAHPQPPMSTLLSSLHRETTTCHQQIVEAHLQMTHTGGRHHMIAEIMALAGKKKAKTFIL